MSEQKVIEDIIPFHIAQSWKMDAVCTLPDGDADQGINNPVVRILKYIAASCLRNDDGQKDDTGKLGNVCQAQPYRKVYHNA